MTRQQWKAMTSDERRARIARICGYKHPRWIGPRDYPEFVGELVENGEKYTECNIDDYERDLDAMYMVEKNLPDEAAWHCYMQLLCGSEDKDIGEQPVRDWIAACHATAAQRAEAFALTMELDEGADQKELDEMADMALEPKEDKHE